MAGIGVCTELDHSSALAVEVAVGVVVVVAVVVVVVGGGARGGGGKSARAQGTCGRPPKSSRWQVTSSVAAVKEALAKASILYWELILKSI